jgi:NitT/TauT family transport system ATP-binding protein
MTDTKTGRIEFDRVQKTFTSHDQKATEVFSRLDLLVKPGEFVSLVGTSGCGKTTLLNMVAGFEYPSAGEVSVDGKPVKGPSRERGVVFQQYAVFPWLTVRQNIEFGMTLKASASRTAGERAAIVSRYLEIMGLSQFSDALPKTLSGGMKQRVAIARAYAADPTILLMDEPFAALDAQSRERMQDALLNITTTEHRTVLFVTHSVEEAIYLSDRIVVLTGRPAKVADDITVEFGVERTAALRLTDDFINLRRRVEKLLH